MNRIVPLIAAFALLVGSLPYHEQPVKQETPTVPTVPTPPTVVETKKDEFGTAVFDESIKIEDEMEQGHIIVNAHFTQKMKVLNSNGSATKTAITKQESDKYNLGFTNTLTLSSNVASKINDFGVHCAVLDGSTPTKSGDLVLLTFYARAKKQNTDVKAAIVAVNGTTLWNSAGKSDKAEYTYHIPTQWTKICLPVTVSGVVGGIRFYMGSKQSDVEIGGVTLEVTDGSVEQFLLPTGYFPCEPYTELLIDYSDNKHYIEKSVITRCHDVEIHGDYVYGIGNSTFYAVSTATQKVVGKVGGLGEVRQLALSEDGKTAVVTSRVDGAFIIAIDDPKSPKIVGRCDTLEYATGVDVANNFVYITNRIFGTEIIDISNRLEPVNVSILRTGEAQSVEVAGNLVFAGCWGERYVDIWDVSSPSVPKHVGKINTNGKGDGLTVYGNYLYVSTGHDESNQSAGNPLNVGYGMGNGMDIYDISDINNPVHMSTVRIDDHFYKRGEDFWTVKVSQDMSTGRIYAYFSNTCTGLYIYDVTDAKAPILLVTVDLTATADNSKSKYDSLVKSYGHSTVSSKNYFPFDTNERQNSPVGGFTVADGKIYIGGYNTGLAVLTTEDVGADIFHPECSYNGNKAPGKPDGTYYNLDLAALGKVGMTEIVHALPGGQVYGVDYKDGLLYAACGNQGIKILDESLKVIKEIEPRSDAIISEVVVYDNRLYTAEGLAGIAIYKISKDGLELEEISRYDSDYSVKFIRLSPDGNYVLCDYGSSRSGLVDFNNLKSPSLWSGQWNSHNALMYWRQISTTLINGRYLASFAGGRDAYWYDFGENPDSSNPRLMYHASSYSIGSFGGGIAGLTGKNSKYGIAIKGDKFYIFDPSQQDAKTNYSSVTGYSFLNPAGSPIVGNNLIGRNIQGKITIHGDLLFLTDRPYGYFYIFDISELDVDAKVFKIKYVKHLTFNGSPDVIRICGDKIVLPLGNQGILSFKYPR